jgi:hypothetical protein
VSLRSFLAAPAAALLLASCATAPVAGGDALEGVTLTLPAGEAPSGSEVFVAGTFNDWDPEATPLAPGEGGWSGFVPLPPGEHRLQLRIRPPRGRERWLPPPGLDRYEPDGFGGMDGVVSVPRGR